MHRATLPALALLALLPIAAAAAEVKALGGYFSPDAIEVVADEEVVWTNDDSMPHTITSTWDKGASFDAVLRGGESFSWAFDAPGDYVVHCRPHAYPNEAGGMDGMAMTIHVTALESSAAIHEVPGAGTVIALLSLVAAVALFTRRY